MRINKGGVRPNKFEFSVGQLMRPEIGEFLNQPILTLMIAAKSKKFRRCGLQKPANAESGAILLKRIKGPWWACIRAEYKAANLLSTFNDHNLKTLHDGRSCRGEAALPRQ